MARAPRWLTKRIGDDGSRAASPARARPHLLPQAQVRGVRRPIPGSRWRSIDRLGNELEAGRTLNSSLQSLIYLGRYPEAMEYAQQAREIFERSWRPPARLARLDANMGNILYRQDRFEEALDLYQRAYRRVPRNRRTPGRSHFPQEHRHLPDQPELISARRWPPTPRRGLTAWSTSMPLLVAWPITTSRTSTICAASTRVPSSSTAQAREDCRDARRRVPRGALRPGSVRNVPGAESQRGRRAPGAGARRRHSWSWAWGTRRPRRRPTWRFR